MSRSVRVTPGRKFADDDLLTAAGLNLLGTPDIELEGQDGEDDQADETITTVKTRFEAESALLAVVRAHREAGRLPVKDLVARGPVADVRYFGAAGDGTTDDVAAINLAIAAVIAAGGGTVLLPYGIYQLGTFTQTVGTVKCHLVANGTASVRFVSVGGGKLRSSLSPGSGYASAILMLTGALTDCVIDAGFENGAVSAVTYPTIGVFLNDSGGALKNVSVGLGAHFRNLSRGIYGGADGVLVNGAKFSYPFGRPCSDAAEYNVGVWADLTAGRTSARWRVTNCDWDGCEASSVAGSRPADGLCRGTSLGWTVSGNAIRHPWGTAIELSLRGIADLGGLSWASAPRPCVVVGNAIDFDDVAGETTRIGRGVLACEPNVVVSGNSIRNAHVGVELLNADYNASDDTGTRMRDFVVKGNVITLAADLKLDDAATVAANRRGGVLVTGFGAGQVSGEMRFLGRTSAGVTTKYWMAPAVGLYYCDEVTARGNRISGPGGVVNTDRVWLAGVSLDGCRYCEVSGNYYRNLNIGTNAGALTYVNLPFGNEIGENRIGYSATPLATEGSGVVWGFTSAEYSNQGTLTPSTIVKKFTSTGTVSRKQRTSFLASGVGWIRVAAGAGYLWGRVRLWVQSGTPMEFNVDYVVAQGGALVAVAGQPIGTVTQARVCTNNSTADLHCHLDVYVAVASGQRVFVEIEGAFFNEGVWGEPVAPAATLAGWTEENATLMETLTFGQGLAVSGGNWNNGHLVLGPNHYWVTAAGVLRQKTSVPTSEGDGTAV